MEHCRITMSWEDKMRMFLKSVLTGAVVVAGLATSAIAGSNDWKPQGPIKMIIAFKAGGGADTHGRLVADEVQAATGWKIIPEQITGKGGVNALVALKNMPSDGSVIALIVTESLGYNAATAKGAGISPADFAGLTTTAGFQIGIVSKSDQGWNDFGDVIAAAKGGKEIRFGTMSPKLADMVYLLGKANGVEFNIIEVKGGKAVLNGVTAGDMDVGFMAGIQGKGVAAGDLTNLASALSEPLKQSPNAPLLSEYGVEFTADGYFVFVAPAGIPDDARKALSAAFAAGTTMGKANAMITKAFGGAVNIMGQELDALLQSEFDGASILMDAVK